MAAINKKEQRKNEKDKYRLRYRVLKELRFWLAGFLAVAVLITAYVGVLNVREGNRLEGLSADHQYRDTVALTTGETEISLMALSYYFYDYLYSLMESENFIRDYRAYGLDPTKPLRGLEYTALRSWYEQLMDETCTAAEATVRYAELARKNSLKLSEEDGEYIDSEIARLTKRAENEGKKLNDYLDYRYGYGMTEKDVREAVALYRLAEKQYELSLAELKKCSDDELSDYYNEHRAELESLDYISYRFEIKEEAEAKEKEQAFAACKTSKEFLALIKEDLPKAGCPKEQVDSVLADCQKRLEYGKTGYFPDWAFDSARVKGDILTRTADGYWEVYYLVRPAGKYGFPSANIRGLLVSIEAYKEETKTKAEAEKLYKQAVENGTEEFFAELVKKHSHDFNTASYGGVYADIVPGDLAEEYNDWVFAEGRKKGDIGMVESNGSYNIFYYTGDGEACWKVTARNALVEERVSSYTKELEGSMEIKMDQAAVYKTLPDNLATDHERSYTVYENNGKVSYKLHGTVYIGFYCLLALSVLLLAVTIWSFAEAYRLQKRYGYTK